MFIRRYELVELSSVVIYKIKIQIGYEKIVS